MIFKKLALRDQPHEQIVFCSHSETGLKAIIAIHSTKLGPSLGGCRMYPYETEEQALEDVLRLSEAMSYKAALSGLSLGGGKSVIWGNPEKEKNVELLRAFGQHIQALNGRYIVAKDMGITSADLEHIGKESSFVVGRPVQKGGVGDPSRSTAQGVYYGIKEAVRQKLKKDSLKGIRVVVQGLGSVGSSLVEFLVKDQAQLFVFDIRKSAVESLKSKFPAILPISEKELFTTPCEVFAPCSVGSVINESTAKQLQCAIIAGGANNQLSSPLIGEKLMDRGILYIPDFVINTGGLIYVSSYLAPKKSSQWIEDKLRGIPQFIKKICEQALAEKADTAKVALNLAKEIIKKA